MRTWICRTDIRNDLINPCIPKPYLNHLPQIRNWLESAFVLYMLPAWIKSRSQSSIGAREFFTLVWLLFPEAESDRCLQYPSLLEVDLAATAFAVSFKIGSVFRACWELDLLVGITSCEAVAGELVGRFWRASGAGLEGSWDGLALTFFLSFRRVSIKSSRMRRSVSVNIWTYNGLDEIIYWFNRVETK